MLLVYIGPLLTALYQSGNAVKAGVRFVSYDHFKHALADSQVRLLRLLLYFEAGSHILAHVGFRARSHLREVFLVCTYPSASRSWVICTY